MLEKSFAYFLSLIIFVTILLMFSKKRKVLETIINYSLIHLMTTIVISESLFPMIMQKKIIEDGVYSERIQTFELFREIRMILSLELTKAQMHKFLIIHAITIILPLIMMGILIGLVIKLQIRSRKKFIIKCILIVITIQVIKVFTCILLGAKYIQVTPEDGLYIFLGCLCGEGVLYIIQKLICNIDYKSRFFSALKNTLLT